MSNKTKLFEEFAPISTEEWKNKITTDLKGADYDKKLVWRTNEGLKIQPFYRLEDVEKISYLDSYPGSFPFTRSTKKTDNSWYVRQNVKVTNIAEANSKILEILNKGITPIGLSIESCKDWTSTEIETLLKD